MTNYKYLENLICVLGDDLDMTGEEIADVLWLTIQRDQWCKALDIPTPTPDIDIVPDIPTPTPDIDIVPDIPTPTPDIDIVPDIPTPTPDIDIVPDIPTPTPDIPTPTPDIDTKTLPIRVPDAPAIREPLKFAYALCLLMQKIPSGKRQILDENATAQIIAETKICQLVLKPELETWLDLAVIIDESPSMSIWGHTIKDFKRLVEHYGIFRNVHIWGLVAEDAEKQVKILPRMGNREKQRSVSYKELIDPNGRCLILIVSDCVSNIWHNRAMLEPLQVWSKHQPLVILQMLPDWFWLKTGLGNGASVLFTSTKKGVANQNLLIDELLLRKDFDLEAGIKIPVINLDNDLARAWSQVLIGKREAITPGFVLPSPQQWDDLEEEIADFVSPSPQQVVKVNAQERIDRFRQTASPIARKLAGLLAAAPLINLPVVRIIQETLLSQSNQVHVAEVFLGGLLKAVNRTEYDGEEALNNPDGVVYDFMDNQIRQILLQDSPVSDSATIFNAVSAYFANRLNKGLDEFVAFLQAPSTEKDESREMVAFANLSVQVLKGMGGEYAKFANKFEQKYQPSRITSEQLKQLIDAILSAFPTQQEFEMMLLLKLGENLEHIAYTTDDTYQNLVFYLIEWAEPQGKLDDLIKGAYETNPENPKLKEFYNKYYNISVPTPSPIPPNISLELKTFEFKTVTIDRKGEPIKTEDKQAQYFTEILPGNVELDMVLIPNGEFIMGAKGGEKGVIADQYPQHKVTIAQPFFMGKYPVTQAQYEAIMGANPSHFKGENRPVEQVSWEMAVEFCKKLSEKTGRVYHLPSEAQWEYAGRAGTTTPFHFGETITSDLANYDGNDIYAEEAKGKYRGNTTDVGNFLPNAFGLYDIHGNVWEWCQDTWHDNYEEAPEDDTTWVSDDENNRLLRGGSWYNSPILCRVAFRYRVNGVQQINYLGFRVSQTLNNSSEKTTEDNQENDSKTFLYQHGNTKIYSFLTEESYWNIEENYNYKKQLKLLQREILSTFPRQKLEMLVRLELDEKLNQIAFGNTYEDLVFNLIKWAESAGKLDDLIRRCYYINSSNVIIKRIYEFLPLGNKHTINFQIKTEPYGTYKINWEIKREDFEATTIGFKITEGLKPDNINSQIDIDGVELLINVEKAIETIINFIQKENKKTLCLPLLGAGVSNLPVKDVATTMLSSILQSLDNLSSNAIEKIIVTDSNEDNIKIINDVAQNLFNKNSQDILKSISLKNFQFETVTVNSKGEIIKRENKQAQYFTEILPGGVELDMVLIPAGEFMMGAKEGEKGANRSRDEYPQHKVTIAQSFLMGKYAVTQAQYEAVMGKNPSKFKGENHPVEQVSWEMAVEFCKKLSEITGKVYHLPSEAQWEYAGRGRTTTPFHFGETITSDLANYNGDYTYAEEAKGEWRKRTTEVGIFLPNSFGLYDIHGNLWEWCEDAWHDNYEEAPEDDSAWITEDENHENYSKRLLRGGSWYDVPNSCRAANRNYDDRTHIDYYVGFRLAQTLNNSCEKTTEDNQERENDLGITEEILNKFFQASNPVKTLDLSQPEDQKYYIDLSSVRGEKVIEELKRTITRLSPELPTSQLFTGYMGCGKSTELLKLKMELEKEGFHVIFFESSRNLDMGDIDVTDILLEIARYVSAEMEKMKIKLQHQAFQALLQRATDLLKTIFSAEINLVSMDKSISTEGEFSLFVEIGKITAKTKDSPKLRSVLRQYFEPRTNMILAAINEELLDPANQQLKQLGKKGLVVIIDNLDRVNSSLSPTGRPQPEYLFIDRGEQLNKLKCHVVYTLPLGLIFSNELGQLINRFSVEPQVLPMVTVQFRDGETCEPGLSLLRQAVLARAFPYFTDTERLGLVTEVFDNLATLDRMCRASGGHLRQLMVLLRSCLEKQDPPLTKETLERVITQRRHQLTRAIDQEEWDLLRQVAKNHSVTGESGYQTLVRSMCIFQYRQPNGESWFDVNPILLGCEELE